MIVGCKRYCYSMVSAIMKILFGCARHQLSLKTGYSCNTLGKEYNSSNCHNMDPADPQSCAPSWRSCLRTDMGTCLQAQFIILFSILFMTSKLDYPV